MVVLSENCLDFYFTVFLGGRQTQTQAKVKIQHLGETKLRRNQLTDCYQQPSRYYLLIDYKTGWAAVEIVFYFPGTTQQR